MAHYLMTNHMHLIAYRRSEDGQRVAESFKTLAHALCAEHKPDQGGERPFVAKTLFSSPLGDAY
ncbi:MAG: hypothetical protein ACRESZ_09980 [Methylococcales bacterium]